MEKLYHIAEISRQGYHKQVRKHERDNLLHSRIKESVIELREDHPCIGARKLFVMLKLKGKIGINKFEVFLSTEGLGIKVKRSPQRTTNSNHHWYKYTNLLHGFKLTGVNQVWVSDITYFMIGEDVYYITFIEDVYSRRILGYSISDNMLHQNNVKALQDSITLRNGADLSKLIHHSDKGSQYCSINYINILIENKFKISMAGNSIENPYVERLNGIIKNDYLYPRKRSHDLKSLKKEMDIVVKLYNEKRPHSQLEDLTPIQFEIKQKSLFGKQMKELELFDFKQHEINRFLKVSANRMNNKLLPTQNSLVGNNHSLRSSYSLESCSSAELSSASLDTTIMDKIKVNKEKSFQQEIDSV
ncbi:MAG: IS3 family transposase [Bacteroidetes bacterium]|nr:MAG: IS3 family transposase [Bacteroidota bacterium]